MTSDGPTFESLGLSPPMLSAVQNLHYTTPTPIQAQCLPPALSGRDLIALAPTGSGKTAAFAIPILEQLWKAPQDLFACVLAPTRELAYQISAQFEALGSAIGVRCVVIVGGDMDRVAQAVALAKRPHIIVATPGRLADHLRSTKGFNLKSIKFLVMDEADRLLDLDMGKQIDDVLQAIPRERTTYLFSATMTTKVSQLQRASLSNPLRVEVSTAYHTVSTLLQYYVLCPFNEKETYFVHLVNSLVHDSMIIFVRTVASAQRLNAILNILQFSSVSLNGEMTQSNRLGALEKFRSGKRKILVATDVASRGLDIPDVDLVINYDMPTHSKDYIHRVGRTARAGKGGKTILMVTQYDVEHMQRLETVLGKQLDLWPTDHDEVMLLRQRVDEAGRVAVRDLKDESGNKKSRSKSNKRAARDDLDRDDDVREAGIPDTRPQKRRR